MGLEVWGAANGHSFSWLAEDVGEWVVVDGSSLPWLAETEGEMGECLEVLGTEPVIVEVGVFGMGGKVVLTVGLEV